MAANKVVFGNKVLIDLTGDTVTEEALLKGYTAHKADGTIITGTAFAGYPNEFVFLDNIQDSSGNQIKDSSGKTIQGQTIYRKARNSVLLDSTGDMIEDGFEQQIEVVKFVWVSFISRLFLHLNPLGTVNAGQFVSMMKVDLRDQAGITTNALAKLGKNEHVSTQVLEKVCKVLHCEIQDIMEFVPDEEREEK